jgi:hypothetical protein
LSGHRFEVPGHVKGWRIHRVWGDGDGAQLTITGKEGPAGGDHVVAASFIAQLAAGRRRDGLGADAEREAPDRARPAPRPDPRVFG